MTLLFSRKSQTAKLEFFNWYNITVKKNCHFDYSCLLSRYTRMINTLHSYMDKARWYEFMEGVGQECRKHIRIIIALSIF